ncbi:MAG: hypothetical protein NXI31_13260 [bacterium]|nr:hypothetical protein [bacterium]
MIRALTLLLLATLAGCTSHPTPLNIALLGRFDAPNSRAELTRLLVANGHTIVDEVGPGVELVVIGKDPVAAGGEAIVPIGELSGYSYAKQNGIEMVDKANVRDRLALLPVRPVSAAPERVGQ